MKKLLALSACLLLISQNVLAGPLGDRFHLGISGGFGIGKMMSSTPTDGAENFSTISWMGHVGFKFVPSFQIRASLGLDDYMNFASSSDTKDIASDDGFLFAGDLDLLWHPLKGRLPLVDPYLLAGVGFPRVLHGGAGVDVSLGGLFGVFGEVLYGTAFQDHRGLGRLGIKIKL